jgi:hypothetical protein
MNPISFFESNIGGGLDDPHMQTPMFFVGIQRDIAPPIRFGRSELQRMRVILIEPRNGVDLEERDGEPWFEVLPRFPSSPHHRALRPRLVRGEILRGENGELYERTGNRIRSLRNLLSGPNGEILDVAHAGQLVQSQRVQMHSEEPQPEREKAQSQAASQLLGFRKLLPEPGQWRIVPFGFFKEMLAAQLVHTERLRDAHRLPCHTQVFELTAAQHLEQLTAAIFGKAAQGQLQPLTHTIVMQLQLGPLLPPPRAPGAASRSPGMLLPGDRFFHLRLVNDPTADESERQGGPEMAQPLKTSIPDRFLKPWEFQISREEALYDLSCASTFFGALGGKLRRFVRFVTFRREFRKWQVLLSGKSVEDQLWSVRPPRGGLTHRFVLAWAKNAIQLADYDPRNMLTEWQIFWRRKGA